MAPPPESWRVLLTGDAIGGVLTYALDLASGLSELGFETVLLLQGPPPAEAIREKALAIPGLSLIEDGHQLDWLASDPEAVKRAGESVAEIASDLRVDLVHINSPALAAIQPFQCPVVATSHSCLRTWWTTVRDGDPPEDFRWRIGLHAAGLHRADAILAPSSSFASATKEAYRLRRPVMTVHNGRTPPARGLAEFGDHRFAFTAGRLWDGGKNAATLDEAASLARTPFFAAGPIVSPQGEGFTLPHLNILGNIEEEGIRGWLNYRPIFVSAALYEPFGLAILEAAQAGCPLVLADIPTFRELWDEAALFVPARDANAFAAVIDRLADSPEERLRLGALARRRSRRFTVEAMARRIATLYRTLWLRREETAA